MNILLFGYLFVAISSTVMFAQDLPKTVIEGKEEILMLDHWAEPNNWRPAECTLGVSDKKSPKGTPTLHMHVPIDHQAGEPKYPVGWPRIDLVAKTPREKDWTSFDRLEFSVYTETSRSSLPKTPITLLVYCPDKNRVWSRDLSELKIGEWVSFSLPIAAMQYVNNVNIVKFSVSESNYQDKDVVDFHFSGFRLVRSVECRIGEMQILTPVLFSDQAELRVQLTIFGTPEEIRRGVPFSLRSGKELVKLDTLAVKRGRQVLVIDLSHLKLAAGEYHLIAFEGEADKKKSASFRIVNSPWQEK
jgi:hypothetical protein